MYCEVQVAKKALIGHTAINRVEPRDSQISLRGINGLLFAKSMIFCPGVVRFNYPEELIETCVNWLKYSSS
jgi:hypothetical protein